MGVRQSREATRRIRPCCTVGTYFVSRRKAVASQSKDVLTDKEERRSFLEESETQPKTTQYDEDQATVTPWLLLPSPPPLRRCRRRVADWRGVCAAADVFRLSFA